MKVKLNALDFHKVDEVDTTIEKLEQAKLTDLQKYVDSCIRQKSPKTGKPIKVNIFKWRKSDVIDLIRENGFEKKAIKWLNDNIYFHVEVFSL